MNTQTARHQMPHRPGTCVICSRAQNADLAPSPDSNIYDTLPATLADLPIRWAGMDSQTPDGCTRAISEHRNMPTSYILRDGQVIGRVEHQPGRMVAYMGDGLTGGIPAGVAGIGYRALADRIATAA